MYDDPPKRPCKTSMEWTFLTSTKIAFPPPTPKSVDFPSESGSERKSLTKGNLAFSLSKGVKVLEIAVGAVIAPTTGSP